MPARLNLAPKIDLLSWSAFAGRQTWLIQRPWVAQRFCLFAHKQIPSKLYVSSWQLTSKAKVPFTWDNVAMAIPRDIRQSRHCWGTHKVTATIIDIIHPDQGSSECYNITAPQPCQLYWYLRSYQYNEAVSCNPTTFELRKLWGIACWAPMIHCQMALPGLATHTSHIWGYLTKPDLGLEGS